MRDYLIEKREKLGMSQQDVADAVGISRQYYNAIENGTRQKKMDITLVAKLSGALNTTLEEIISSEKEWTEKAS